MVAIAPTRTITTATSFDPESAFREVREVQKRYGYRLNLVYILLGAVAVLLLVELMAISYDIVRDNRAQDKIYEINNDLLREIAQLEQKTEETQKQMAEQQQILKCFSITDFWNYPKCFSK